MFNGNITTGCSYDPFTGNTMRSVTDLVVAGGVGSYPLAFSRIANSRQSVSGQYQFGAPGGWQHSYSWSLGQSDESQSQYPPGYEVFFPDGRVETFTGTGTPGAAGLREKMLPLNLTTMLTYLVLSDGGKVQFQATQHSRYDGELHVWFYWYTYQAQAIIDPYGLSTTLAYNGDGSLNTIVEPAGRWIQIVYVTTPWTNGFGQHDRVIDHISASDGRTVQYNYGYQAWSPGTMIYTYLGNVVYYGDNSIIAYYSYQAPNMPTGGSYNGAPLLASCNDPLYAGPMKYISYTYATVNSDNSTPAVGQIQSENSGTTGQAVSTLQVVVSGRAETKGDGSFRNFTFQGYQVSSWSDFVNHLYAQQLYDQTTGFITSFADRNGQTTNFTCNAITGAITSLTHPPDANNNRYSITYTYTDPSNPYYLDHVTNENNSTIYYRRDAYHRVYEIDYPDGGYETFTYNNFNQILTHRMTSGGTETFEYDGRGLKTAYRDPYHQAGNPTAWYLYDSLDRLWKVTDARGGYAGDPSYTTIYAYNQRGQVTRLTHPDTNYVQYGYDSNGNRTSVIDELNHGTTYAYDDYRRVTSVTDALIHTASYDYRLDGVNSYVHTTSCIKSVSSPMGKRIDYAYDANFRRTSIRQAPGTADEAWTYFFYDAVGNLTRVQDPLGNVTTFGYDNRNRKTSATNPAPFTDQTTRWQYDQASNLTFETRADGSQRQMQYDSMNRVFQTYGFAHEGAAYVHDPAGNLTQMTDPIGAVYYFGYDLLNRQTSASYPPDANAVYRTENWHYDPAGNMDQYTNPAGQIKTLSYDNRNRPTSSSWNSGGGPSASMSYDAASRLSSIITNNGETTVAFGYDDANRKLWEDQTLTGYPTHRVWTDYDADGNRAYLYTPGWYLIYYDYTQRNQLWHINDTSHAPVFTYTYDVSGNMTRRQDVYGGSTHANYDALNRPTMWEQIQGVPAYARTWYQYDSLSRVTATSRDETGKGERYGYDALGQLTSVLYNSNSFWGGPPTSWDRSVTYDQDVLNRHSINDNGQVTAYTADQMNQYTNVGGQTLSYDANFNLTAVPGGLSASYNSAKQLTSASNGGNTAQFTYDGLGRCVKRVINGATTVIVYDGWQPMLEWDGASNFIAWNIYGAGPDEILMRNQSGVGTLRYHLDPQSNVMFLLDSNGNGIEKYTYDAFSQPTITDWNSNVRTQSAYGNRFMFSGREYIKELGIYDYRNRFYHPGHGRFMQTDPIGFGGGDANLYRYCGNNPVNGSDPTGLDVITMAHPQDWAHGSWGVTDPLSSSRVTWFDFAPYNNPPHAWNTVPGGWKVSDGTSWGISSTTAYPPLTPEQDLVALSALIDASQVSGQTYNFFAHNCWQAGFRVLDAALMGPGGLINPLDPNTGNIYNAQGNWVGWENPDTGNIYDAEGDWASWNSNWDSNNSGGDFGFVSVSGGSFDTGGGWWGSGGTTTYYPQQIGYDILPGGSIGVGGPSIPFEPAEFQGKYVPFPGGVGSGRVPVRGK